MSGWTGLALGIALAWSAGLIWVWRQVKRTDDQQEDADREAEAEEQRRRDALGYVTRLDSFRRLDRIDRVRSNRR